MESESTRDLHIALVKQIERQKSVRRSNTFSGIKFIAYSKHLSKLVLLEASRGLELVIHHFVKAK